MYWIVYKAGGDVVLCYIWYGFAEIFILAWGIAIFQD